MKCISPISIKVEGQQMFVDCNKCNFCLQARRQDWAFRLYQELRTAQSASFLTLTYADEHVPLRETSAHRWVLTLSKKDLHKFHKSIRQSQTRTLLKIKKREKLNSDRYKALKKKWRIKYYSVGEYGITDRPHYHSIMFGIHPLTLQKLGDNKIWNKGWIKNGSVGFESIAYCTKYLIDKAGEFTHKQKPFTVMSKGIGLNYLHSKRHWHKQAGDHIDDYRYYVVYQGNKQRLPRYYKDRMFSKLEKQIIGMNAYNESLQRYLDEIERLAKREPNPMEYYEQLIQHQHEQIRIKSLQLNKL